MPGSVGRSQPPTESGPPVSAPSVAGRYDLVRELGTGGMGTVYLAHDRLTGESVALKQLSRADAKNVLRFKREFRSVAHVQHVNLVRLYDLECEQNGIWFLTMEYVPGTDLVSHLRRGPGLPDAARIADAFAQVARGVTALHASGMLHRDLKPSNVLVAGERAVVMDFGLARGIDESDARVTEEGSVTGTPAYMAPEQARAQPLSEATDWYAFGVMLYEVLTGALPFEGTSFDILHQKVDRDPPPVEQLEPHAPRALSELCMALLSRDPNKRPNESEILVRLGAARPLPPRQAETDTTSFTDIHTMAAVFVGRGDSLRELTRAFADADRGQTVAVHVRGVSGAGKSALLERFVAQLESSGAALGGSDVLVLRSRCYEREAMPFKALDSVIDELVKDLAQRDDMSVSHLLPADIQALAQLFPAFERVHAVKKLIGMQRAKSHARTYRQRAETALRELFGRLAQSRRLVVWVDDLHWGDLDSVTILRSWLQQDSGVPFLLLLSYRSDEVETSPALRALLAPSEPGQSRVSERHVEIGPLTAADMRSLCLERLGARASGREALVEQIVAEADGNPFLASQLASLALAKIERGESGIQALSLIDLVTQTQAMLPPEASSLLSVLAVAGRPMAPKLALRVAGVRHGGRAVLHELRSLNLVRTRDADSDRLVEIYHDRIREHVYGALSGPVLQAIHSGLLNALEHSGRADPDWLFSLALGAGDRALALQYGLQAAERAHATLAFERAAEVYRSCLELSEVDAERDVLWRKLGQVLGYSGRGGRAAEALLEAAKLCQGPNEALELKRMAASHLVRSGRFEQGDALFEEVMAAAGIRAPRSEGKLVAAVLWERTLLSLRGLSFQRRSAAEISPAVLARIDLLEDLRIGSHNHDALRSALFGTQSLRLALDAGEPMRIARALCTVATFAASAGTRRGSATANEMLALADTLTQHFGTTRERMELNVARTAVSFFETRLTDVLGSASEVERALQEMPPESGDVTYFFKFATHALRLGALSQLDWRRFQKEFAGVRYEAQATENVLALLLLALNEFLNDEIAGQPELSVARLDAQRELLPRDRFTLFHVLHMAAVISAACATGRHEWGFQSVAGFWSEFLRSPLRHNTGMSTIAHMARGRLLINEYVRTRADSALLAQAEKSAKSVRSRIFDSDYRLLGRIANLRGNRERALELFSKSAIVYGSRGVSPEVARDQCAVGLLTGGEHGQRQARIALDELEQKFGCRDARAIIRAHYPELAQALP
ncbi:MAG TPA: protein kinase [Polyangiales bacterium]|nr:protein kinase [Polyangiales bacterium]